jgi:hypothetical protein
MARCGSANVWQMICDAATAVTRAKQALISQLILSYLLIAGSNLDLMTDFAFPFMDSYD